MKAAFAEESEKISIKEIELKKLQEGEILVKMRSCGICGSDLEKVFGKYGKPSMRLGHEPAGIVIKVGKKVKDFKIGDRVFTHHHVPCYSCHFCKHGKETMCTKYYETNLSPCGLSQEYVVPEWSVTHGGVLKLPDSVSFDQAAMIEPLACCVRSWTKISYTKGDSVAIFGLGPTGMMHVMLAKKYGFEKIFCFDVNEFRLDFAKKFNITEAFHSLDKKRKEKILEATSKRGVDIAIVATGSLTALLDALDMVRKGGTVMMFGVPSQQATIELDMGLVYSKEITLMTSYAASDIDTKEALELIKSGKIEVNRLITHRYSIDNTREAFEHAHNGSDAMKIIINS